MVLVPHDKTKLGKMCGSKVCNDLYTILTEFLEGEHDCVRLSNHNYENAHSMDSSLRASVKRYYKGQIKVMKRGDNVFLVKTLKITK